jgi:hypothetical protein
VWYVEIPCPKYLAAFAPQEAIAFCSQVEDSADEVIDVDASRLVFVDPLALTLLGATLHKVKQWRQRLRVFGLADGVGAYLLRMDVFSEVEFAAGPQFPGRRRDRRDSLVELTRIDSNREVPEAAWRMAQALVGTTSATFEPDGDPTMDATSPADRLLNPIKYVLNELLENGVVHGRLHGFAESCRVWGAVQYYKRNDLVRLAVTDTGCGFLETLRGHPDLHVCAGIGDICTYGNLLGSHVLAGRRRSRRKFRRREDIGRICPPTGRRAPGAGLRNCLGFWRDRGDAVLH